MSRAAAKPPNSLQRSLSTAALNPGTYQAYLLYDNGYGVMAGPVALTVTASGTIAVDGQASGVFLAGDEVFFDVFTVEVGAGDGRPSGGPGPR